MPPDEPNPILELSCFPEQPSHSHTSANVDHSLAVHLNSHYLHLVNLEQISLPINVYSSHECLSVKVPSVGNVQNIVFRGRRKRIRTSLTPKI